MREAQRTNAFVYCSWFYRMVHSMAIDNNLYSNDSGLFADDTQNPIDNLFFFFATFVTIFPQMCSPIESDFILSKKNESIWSTRMHPWKWHSEMWISKLHQLRTFYLYILYDVPNRKTPDTFRISEREWLEEENSMQHTSPCCWTRTTFNQNRRVDYSFFFLLGCCYSDSGWLQRRYVFCSCYNGIRTRSDVCVVFWTGAMCSSALHTAKLVTC